MLERRSNVWHVHGMVVGCLQRVCLLSWDGSSFIANDMLRNHVKVPS